MTLCRYVKDILGPKIRFTPEGGFAILLTNKTGAASVKGEVVESSVNFDDSVELNGADDTDSIGVFYDSGIAADAEAWVVVSGIAEVMLVDGDDAVRGDWVGMSATIGRAEALNPPPPVTVADHFKELGHCLQSASSGTDVLVRCVLHFN